MGALRLTPLQHYLRDNPPEKLKEEFDINFYKHPKLPLMGFKYGIHSPKTHEITRECRGIVLETGTWKVVAKPFKRFFNYGEHIEEMQQFNWGNFTANTKEDGSLIIVYYYDNEWHVNTSGSFGFSTIETTDFTWRELFWKTAKDIKVDKMDKQSTYIFELCSPYNKIVRIYNKPVTYLLGVFENKGTPFEYPHNYVDYIANEINALRPERHEFSSLEQIENYLIQLGKDDPTNEGVVIRDISNLRFKLKSATYISLHHMCDNGNLYSPKRLVPWVLVGDQTELLTYFPEAKEALDKVAEQVNAEWVKLVDAWEAAKNLESQKDFALCIKDKTRFQGILFSLRKTIGAKATKDDLLKAWQESAELITKVLFKE